MTGIGRERRPVPGPRIRATSRANGTGDATDDACAGCATGTSRRDFPVQGAATVGAPLAGPGIRPERAAALPVRENEGVRAGPTELTFPLPEADGVFISGRATRGMDRYPIRLSGAGLAVDTGSAIHQDEEEAAWNATAVRLSSTRRPAGTRRDWPRHRRAARFTPIES